MKTATAISDRAFIRLLLPAAVILTLLFQPRYDVGFFNDDASFVLLARRLLDFLFLRPGPGLGGIFSHFMPGYPVLLAPFTALFSPHWAWLRLTTAAVSLLTVFGLWKLLEGWLSPGERRWAVLLYALHPLLLLCSGMVMADPFLACLFVYALLGLKRVLAGTGGWRAYALLLTMAAWAALTKPIGILLAAALTAALISAKAWKALRLTALFIWLPCLLAGLLIFFKNGSPTDYAQYLAQGLSSLAQQSVWLRGYGTLHAFVLVYGLAIPWPRGPAFDLAGALLIAGVIYVCAKGLSALLSGPRPGKYLALAAGLLVIGQGLVLSLWTVYSERYALPLLPFFTLFLTAGAFGVLKPRPMAARALLGALALGFAVRAGLLVRETYSPLRPAQTKLCTQTLEWIRTETPPESRFIGKGAAIDLYTGRSGRGMFAAPNADAFLSDLSRFHITHALVTEQTVLSTQGSYATDQAWQQAAQNAWIRRHTGSFKRIYSNRAERTEVYEVRVPAGWDKAVDFYALALGDLKNSDRAAAAARLRLALKEAPDLTSALVALASLRAAPGKDTAEAEKLLRRALALEPNYPRASRLLAGLLEARGRRSEAEKVNAAARAALKTPPFEAVP